MSGGLAPSKSTIYVSNLPFSLTNNDVHKLFEKHGAIAKVTILCDKNTRKSKGVAFVLFKERQSAHNAVRAINRTEMFGRTIKCSIAKDNGRASDFIRRKEYPDKSRCYECGEEGHLIYKCPKNLFGEREPPKKKERKRKRDQKPEDGVEDSDEEYVPPMDTWADVISTNAIPGSAPLLLPSTSTAAADEDSDEKKYKRSYWSESDED